VTLYLYVCVCWLAPDRVEQLIVYKRSRRMLGLRWAAPKQMYGSLESFIVTHQAMGSSHQTMKSVIKPMPCVVWPHLYCHMVNSLLPDTQYIVSVSRGSKTFIIKFDLFACNVTIGYFCDRTCQNAILKFLAQSDRSRSSVQEPFFPGIGITPPLSSQMLGYSLHARTFL
jgi:hypothetical protein